MKQTDFQFYMNSWRRDHALRSCSLAARGLWADMLSIMHEAKPYGFLALKNGQPLYATQLSCLTLPLRATYLSAEDHEAIQDGLSRLSQVMREIETFFEEAGPQAQAQQSAFYLSVSIILAGVFSAVIVEAVGIVCAGAALASIISACGLALLRLVYVLYERDMIKTQAQWAKRKRQWNTLENYFALFWFNEMVMELSKVQVNGLPAAQQSSIYLNSIESDGHPRRSRQLKRRKYRILKKSHSFMK